jgi:hypothetical protein
MMFTMPARPEHASHTCRAEPLLRPGEFLDADVTGVVVVSHVLRLDAEVCGLVSYYKGSTCGLRGGWGRGGAKGTCVPS